jgi:hypothetical protein
LVSFSNKNEAIAEFCDLYLEKTGNEWDERASSLKKPNKFYPMELDYGNEVNFNI